MNHEFRLKKLTNSKRTKISIFHKCSRNLINAKTVTNYKGQHLNKYILYTIYIDIL